MNRVTNKDKVFWFDCSIVQLFDCLIEVLLYCCIVKLLSLRLRFLDRVIISINDDKSYFMELTLKDDLFAFYN